MAKLILSMDGLVLKEIPLTKERTTIGRKPHNDIQIDNLAVSGDLSLPRLTKPKWASWRTINWQKSTWNEKMNTP